MTEDDWFYDAVAYNYSENLMTGVDETHFAPNEQILRAQFAAILYRMNGEPEVEYKAVFPDVQDGVWYTDAILWANSTGVVTGYQNTGLFGTSDPISREQMAVMMYRYAKYAGYDTSKKEDLGAFRDAEEISGYAVEAIQWAVGNGIISGKDGGTMLDPQGMQPVQNVRRLFRDTYDESPGQRPCPFTISTLFSYGLRWVIRMGEALIFFYVLLR